VTVSSNEPDALALQGGDFQSRCASFDAQRSDARVDEQNPPSRQIRNLFL